MRKRYILISILLLVIGFASVTTTLVLNGTIGIGVKLDDFNVIFIEALLDGKYSEKVSISADKKSITFTTDRLSNLGDSVRIDYKVKNTSTQYDADVTINCTNEVNEYVKVSGQFDGNNIPLENVVNMKAQEIKNGYLNAELIQAYVGEDTQVKITCKIVVTATSRESYVYTVGFNSNGGNKIDEKRVILNESYGELPVPERDGYNFLGWYEEYDNKVDEETTLSKKGDQTLHAKWEAKVYPVNIVVKENGSSEVDNISVAYSGTTDIKITPGNNYYVSNIECDNGYTAENYNSKVPQYSEQIIKIKNNDIENSGTCTFEFKRGIYEYGYIGSEQEFIVPLDGEYKIETWGAGGDYYNMGGYTSGKISLFEGNRFYLYVGGRGIKATTTNGTTGAGYNGGGAGGYYKNETGTFADYTYGGSGATDIRLKNGAWNNFESLKSRIMVAGGGAGSSYSAGGLISYGYQASYPPATQTSGASFGAGCFKNRDSTTGGFGSGGGYYGGNCFSGGANGAGGSSYISGHNGCDAIAKSSTSSKIIHTGQANHYSGLVFKDTTMVDGEGYTWTDTKGAYTGMPAHDGKSTMVGNTGDGYAKVTLISID